MNITFKIYNEGKRTFLWDWREAYYIPRKGEFISLETLGYGDIGVDTVALVQDVLWKDKDHVEITLGL